MIARVLEQERAIRQVLGNDRKSSHLIPTWQDIDVLESINKALSPLADLTDILSEEKYVSVSSIKPLLNHMQCDILVPKEEDTRLTKDIKKNVSTYMERKYEQQETSELLDVATFLDPRFKMKFVVDSDKDNIKDRIIREGTEAQTAKESTNQEHTIPQSTSTDSSTSVDAPPPAKKRKLGSILRQCMAGDSSVHTLTPKTPQQKAEIEVESYLRIPLQDVEGDPLQWWKVEEKNYPILATLARKYLCICATSSPSERLFSTSGLLVTPKRSSLKPDKVNMLVFLSRNL